VIMQAARSTLNKPTTPTKVMEVEENKFSSHTKTYRIVMDHNNQVVEWGCKDRLVHRVPEIHSNSNSSNIMFRTHRTWVIQLSPSWAETWFQGRQRAEMATSEK
jgi:hypothetical protein